METVPLSPISKEDISKLETALLVQAIFDPEVIEKIKDPKERVTWVDSLAVAAGAFARRKAGMSITEIADELGRSESTIRNHIEGKTEAGKIIQKVYEKLVKNKGKLEIEIVEESISKKKLEELKMKLRELEENLKKVIDIQVFHFFRVRNNIKGESSNMFLNCRESDYLPV